MKKILSFIMAIFMLLSLCACGAAGNTSDSAEITDVADTSEQRSFENADYSIKYDLKINPEFTVYADENLCVTNITAENDDAENVLACVDVIGMSVNDAFDVLAEEAKAQGYLTSEKGNTVEITILEKDDETLPTCHICNGCGTIMCAECNGTGIICDTCELCNSTGVIIETQETEEWTPCTQCGGLGYMTTADSGCWACHGSGICYLCGGTGYDIVTNEFGDIVYEEDGTPETYPCVFCKGSGSCTNCLGISCHRCNEDGCGENPGYEHSTTCTETETECPDCHGLGYIPCGDSFNGYNWCPCCWGSGIEGTGDPDYEKWMAEHGY